MPSSFSVNQHAPGSTDEMLIRGLHDRDDDAWTRFVDEYASLIYVWCRRFDLKPEDALDVSQKVFQAVSQSISKFEHRSNSSGSFRGWLFTVTRNQVRNHLTKELKQPQAIGGTTLQMMLLEQPEDVDQESLSDTNAQTVTPDVAAVLEQIEADFERQTWQCFWLVAVEQVPAVEVAQRLGMRPSAVRQSKYRVMQRIRQELDFLE